MTMHVRLPADPYAIHPWELVVDSFAGGGGASKGIELALGRSPDIAINHDAEAIAMHRRNHPTTRHLNHDVWKADPVKECGGRPVGLLWASPDCKNFSRAKGGPIKSKRSRDLAWVVIHWAQKVQPRIIALENVSEFLDWADLDPEGAPIPAKKGETFAKFVRQLEQLGYEVQWRLQRACDYGAPTIRKRLFVIARRDGGRITWPEPTHGSPDDPRVVSGQMLTWRTAAECIDWSVPCPSIFLDREQAREVGANRPLAPNTLKRTAKGVMRYVVNAAKPFLVSLTHQGGDRIRDIDAPAATITAAHRGETALVTPFITKFRQGATGSDLADPLPTVTANGFSKRPGGAMPLGLIAPVITHAQHGGRSRPADEPLHTIAASPKDQNQVVAVHIQSQYSQSIGSGADDPISTITAAGGGKQALVAAFLGQQNTGLVGRAAEEPLSTIVGKGCTQTVMAAHLTNLYTSNTAGGEGDVEKPLKTITAGGGHAALVGAFLQKYYGADEGQAQGIDEPTHTITTKGRFGLVTVEIGGEPYVIVDIGMRMLQPKELFAAQGFPPDYIFDVGIDEHGRQIKLTKTAQIRMCGNSVSPANACALIAAQFPNSVRAVPQAA
jgi:DNA (cytosine-5)-methyltransferase 1